ncbi:MAG: replication-relaxation family protein, partial [Litorilinea sp.]
ALQRPEPAARCGLRLTPRDADIIHAVCTYRALTAPQINKLFFPEEAEQESQTISSRCRYRLKLLFQHGYLFRDAPPAKYNEGRKPLVYFLDREAIRVLVITTSSARLQNLWTMTNQVAGHNRDLFWFSTLEQIAAQTVLTAPIWRVGEHTDHLALLDVAMGSGSQQPVLQAIQPPLPIFPASDSRAPKDDFNLATKVSRTRPKQCPTVGGQSFEKIEDNDSDVP